MDRDALRTLQAPLKERYAEAPETAVVTLHAEGTLDETGISCSVQTGRALAQAGLHPATGGDGTLLCSGDMLLEALVACAGAIHADGELDFRGTLGVDKQAAVGLRRVDLRFELDAPDASDEQLATLLKLTERYCVVLQTLRGAPPVVATLQRS